MLGSPMDGRSLLACASASECTVSSHGCASRGCGHSVRQCGFVRPQITCAVCDYCVSLLSPGTYRLLFWHSSLLPFCGYHTDSSNQSLEPTAGRCTKKVEGLEMIVESKAMLAPDSGVSAPSR